MTRHETIQETGQGIWPARMAGATSLENVLPAQDERIINLTFREAWTSS